MDKKEITDYLAKKVFNKELNPSGIYIMLKNKQIYFLDDYGKLVKSNLVLPEDALVYIDSFDNSEDESYSRPVEYLFPLIDVLSIYDIVENYLDKLGFYRPYYHVYPATGLKYYVIVRLFSDRLVIELTDIDTVATNTGLRKIVVEVLGKDILTKKEISWDQREEIIDKLYKQKIFAGHNLDEAHEIIERYYTNPDTSLAKEVLAVSNAYNRILQPYRVVYDTTTRRQVLM
jgi:hypothetical protein